MFISGMVVWLLVLTSPGHPKVVQYLDSRVACEAQAQSMYKQAKPVHTGKCIRAVMSLTPL